MSSLVRPDLTRERFESETNTTWFDSSLRSDLKRVLRPCFDEYVEYTTELLRRLGHELVGVPRRYTEVLGLRFEPPHAPVPGALELFDAELDVQVLRTDGYLQTHPMSDFDGGPDAECLDFVLEDQFSVSALAGMDVPGRDAAKWRLGIRLEQEMTKCVLPLVHSCVTELNSRGFSFGSTVGDWFSVDFRDNDARLHVGTTQIVTIS